MSQTPQRDEQQRRYEELSAKLYDETSEITNEEIAEQVDLYYELSGDERVDVSGLLDVVCVPIECMPLTPQGKDD
jgi:hypothetical protein